MWTLQCDVELKRMSIRNSNDWKILNRNHETAEIRQINIQDSHIRIRRNDWTLSWMYQRTCRRKTSDWISAKIYQEIFEFVVCLDSWMNQHKPQAWCKWKHSTSDVLKIRRPNRLQAKDSCSEWRECMSLYVHAANLYLNIQIYDSNQKILKSISNCVMMRMRKMPIPYETWYILTMMFSQLFILLCKSIAWFQMIATPRKPKIHRFERSIQNHRKRNSKESNHKIVMNDRLFSASRKDSQNHIQCSESIQQMQKTIFDYHEIRFDCDWWIYWCAWQRPCTYSNHNHFNEWWTCGEIRTRNKTVRQNQSNREIAKVVIRCSNKIEPIHSTIHWNRQNQCDWMRQNHCWILACESSNSETIQNRLFRLYTQWMMIQTSATWKEETASCENQKATNQCMWRCRITLSIPKATFQL